MYQTFCRQLYHTCLKKVFSILCPSMTQPEIALCPDGYFCWVVFSLGPYIVDYPEQVWLAGIVQNWCHSWVYWAIPVLFLTSLFISCEAIPDNLDDLKALPCCHHKREFLITNFDPGIIWDNYGFRADVIVHDTICFYLYYNNFSHLAFYSLFPKSQHSYSPDAWSFIPAY